MEVRGGEESRQASWTKKTRHSGSPCDVGQKFAYDNVGRVFGKIGKPWKRNAFVAAAGKLYLLIRFTFLLG
ncbi:hypothetical protein T06_9039 [Trichinella sp. T6]|nr:hypothetical protein T06_9039 [Trichinella sp. T6]